MRGCMWLVSMDITYITTDISGRNENSKDMGMMWGKAHGAQDLT